MDKPQTGYRTLFLNASWMMFGQAVVKPLWFVFITAMCMRLLGPGSYGIFSASLALAMLAATVSDFGTTHYTTREVARNRQRGSQLVVNALAARAGITLVAGSVLVLVASALDYSAVQWTTLMAAYTYALAFQLAEYCRAFYRAAEVLRDEALFVIGEKVVVVSAGAALLLATRSPDWTLTGMALGMSVVAAANVVWVHRRYAAVSWLLLNRASMRRILHQAFPMGLVLVFSAVPLSAGPVLTEALLGEEAAGLYSSAQRILEALQSLTFVFVVTVFARFSDLYFRQEWGAFRKLLRGVLGLLVGLTLVMAWLLSHYAPALIRLIDANGQFEEAGTLLSLMGWLSPLMSTTYILVFALISSDAHNVAAWLTGVAAVLSAVLMVGFVPTWSLLGPALALGIVFTLITLVAYGYIERDLSHKMRRDAIQPVSDP